MMNQFTSTEITDGPYLSNGLNMNLGAIAHTVTRALDYVGVDDHSHGRRVGLFCHRIAHFLGWNQKQRHAVLIAGMLHDVGVSSTGVHQKLVDELEWEHADEHCQRGSTFLEYFEPFKKYAVPIRYHHTRWNELPADLGLIEKDFANLIFLADRLDVVQAKFQADHSAHDLLEARDSLIDELRPHDGILFAPHLFAAMEMAAKRESFWLEAQDEFLDTTIFETLAGYDHSIFLNFEAVLTLGELLSMIVDAKSPFTHYHSLRVADLVYSLSRMLGYDEREREMIRLAALLHDIGKLRTPDEILEKDEALTVQERNRMKQHPLDSKMVLNDLFPNTPIAKWASQHHEKLNGTGYPFGWSGDQIDRETRILSICDIFQALSQPRPYRRRLGCEDVLEIMQVMVDRGDLDPEIWSIAKANAEELYQISIREGGTHVVHKSEVEKLKDPHDYLFEQHL